MSLGIRVSTDVRYGMGHLVRCLSIRQHLNGRIIWFIDDKNKNIENYIPENDKIIYEGKKDCYENLKIYILEKKINKVLLDNYFINAEEVRKLDEKLKVAIIIDNNFIAKVNIIICPQPIDLKIIEGVKYLCGPKYAPIPSFYQKKKYDNSSISLLISFGSYDSKGITLKVIDAVKRILSKNNYNFNAIIVLGKDSPILQKVKLSIKGISSFKLIIGIKNMESIYNNCNIAVGAPGLSHLERMYFGIASLIIPQNELHESLAQKWVNLGVAFKSENLINSIETNLEKLFQYDSILQGMVNKGKIIIDGKGASRIANEINKWKNKDD